MTLAPCKWEEERGGKLILGLRSKPRRAFSMSSPGDKRDCFVVLPERYPGLWLTVCRWYYLSVLKAYCGGVGWWGLPSWLFEPGRWSWLGPHYYQRQRGELRGFGEWGVEADKTVKICHKSLIMFSSLLCPIKKSRGQMNRPHKIGEVFTNTGRMTCTLSVWKENTFMRLDGKWGTKIKPRSFGAIVYPDNYIFT